MINSDFFVDLFLLWLLYRFMKPQRVHVDGKTEASALLFAHDGKEAQKLLLNWFTGDDEKLQKRHKDFIDFVIKDWITEIVLETSVTLEFMD